MPTVNFFEEFNLRYVRDEPIIKHRGRPFFPNQLGTDAEGSTVVKGKYLTPKGNKVARTVHLDHQDLDLRFPSPGWLNVGTDRIFYFSIKNLQQYRFALTYRNAMLYDPHLGKYVDPVLLWKNTSEGKSVAEAVFCREHYTVKKAYQLTALNTSHVGAAFSRDLAFILWPGYSVPLVAYRGKPIAIAQSSEKVMLFSHLSCMKEILNEYFSEVEVV